MGLVTFIHSDFSTQKKKLLKWWHRNDWAKAHSPSISTRIKTECYYVFHGAECIVIDGWLIKFYEAKESFMNWGDDINLYLLEILTKKRIIPAEKLLFKSFHRKFTIIGSVLPSCMNKNTIVWGSGCMDFERNLKWNNHPKKILAVRGPLTRDYLLRNSIDCPEVYGDPALLLPMVYQPVDKKKKYAVTIIPHHRDWDDYQVLMSFIKEFIPNVHVTNMTDYDNWTDIIDEIVQSEVVFSSSHHGLIVSDAYGIPNRFAEFVYRHPKYDKYEDYYLSLDRLSHTHTHTHTHTHKAPIFGKDIPLYARGVKAQYIAPLLNLEPLIMTCPFELKNIKI